MAKLTDFMFSFFANAFKIADLKKRLLFTLFVIVIFRILSHIPVPGVDITALRNLIEQNNILGLLNIFSGGSLKNFSIVTVGLNPYISASIIMQLMTMIFPSLEAMSKEGEAGRQQINQYTRYLTVPLALVQSYSVYFLFKSQSLMKTLNTFDLIILVLTLTAGTMLLMWIGELLTEYGVGQGISMIIFVGIVSAIPQGVIQTYSTISSQGVFNILLILLFAVLVIAGVVFVNEGTRNIPVEYAKKMKGSFQGVVNYLPIKVNQAGVIPIIFAVYLVFLPSIAGKYLEFSTNPALKNIGVFLVTNFSSVTLWYNATYFVLVVLFTYFYTAVQFNPDKIAEDVKNNGGFIPGIRPGKPTSEYLGKVITRITLGGALFLGILAVLPSLIQRFTNVTTLTIGGTSLLIVVSVVLETIRQIESMMETRNYDSFLD